MKDSTSESPRSVTGRSPRIKFNPAPVLKDDVDLSRAEQFAAMREYAMYQRIMSSRPSNADALPPPLSTWSKTNAFKELHDDADVSGTPDAEVENTPHASNYVELDGIFELDL